MAFNNKNKYQNWYGKNYMPSPISGMSSSLLTLFPVEYIGSKCEVLWINQRWLQGNGLETQREEVFNDVILSLIEHFGVRSLETGSAKPCYLFGAERYGDTGGSLIGGGGRSGIFGNFNAKGIGLTPLASNFVDSEYKTGRLPLSEAIREVVFSEITAAELPHSSVPVIAILTTGEKFSFSKDSEPENCAIIIRPNFLRPAHFERSIFFGSSGFRGSDQYIDTIRVKQMIQSVSLFKNTDSAADYLEIIFDKFSQQIGESNAHRLWSGQFSTSNISTDGKVVDFGAFRTLSSWQQARGRLNQKFGKDHERLACAYRSLSHYFEKYANRKNNYTSLESLTKYFKKKEEFFFKKACIKQFPYSYLSPNSANCFSELMFSYYSKQQQHSYQEGNKPSETYRPWIHKYLWRQIFSKGKAAKSDNLESEISEQVYYLLKDCSSKFEKEVPFSTACNHILRWLCPRPLLHFTNALKISKNIACSLSGDIEDDRQNVGRKINKLILKNRRVWNNLPVNFHPTDFEFDGISYFIKGIETGCRIPTSYVYAPIYENKFYLNGHKFDVETLSKPNICISENMISGYFTGV